MGSYNDSPINLTVEEKEFIAGVLENIPLQGTPKALAKILVMISIIQGKLIGENIGQSGNTENSVE